MANEITSTQWEQYREHIVRLRRKGVRLNGPGGIIDRMDRDYGFRMSHCQIELQLSKWHERKNLSKQEWCRILRVIDRYHELGKKCPIRMNGELISKGKLDKKRRLYRKTLEYRKAQGALEECLPDCISIDTGSSLAVSDTAIGFEEQGNQSLTTNQQLPEIIQAVDPPLVPSHATWDGSEDLSHVGLEESNSPRLSDRSQDPSTGHPLDLDSVVERSAMALVESTDTETVTLQTNSNELSTLESALPDLFLDNRLNFRTMTPFEQRMLEMYSLPSPTFTQDVMIGNNRSVVMEEPHSSQRQGEWLPFQGLRGTPTPLNLLPRSKPPTKSQYWELQPSEDMRIVTGEIESAASCDALSKASSMKASLAALLPPDNIPITALLDRRNVALEQAFAYPIYRILISSIENNFAGLNNAPLGEIFKLLKQDAQMRPMLVQYLQQTPKALGRGLVEKLFIAAIEEQDVATVTELLGTGLAKVNDIVCTFEGVRYTAIQRAVMMPNTEMFWSLLDWGADPRCSISDGVQILALALKAMRHGKKMNLAMVDTLLSHEIEVPFETVLLALELQDKKLVVRLLSCFSFGPDRQIYTSRLLDDKKFAPVKMSMLLESVIYNLDEPSAVEIIWQLLSLRSNYIQNQKLSLKRPLILAVQLRFTNVLQCLLPLGCSRAEPLAVAVQLKDEDLVRFLLICIDSALVPCTIQDECSWTTPFAEAIRTRDAKFIAIFESHPRWKQIWGSTMKVQAFEAMVYASCEVGNFSMCQKLVEYVWKDGEAKIELLSLGLQAAVENGYEHIALYLLDAGSLVKPIGDFLFEASPYDRSNHLKLTNPRKHCLFQALEQERQCLFERLMESRIAITDDLGAICIAHALKNRIDWAIKSLFLMRPPDEDSYLLAALKQTTECGIRSEFFQCVLQYDLPFDVNISASDEFAIAEALGTDNSQMTRSLLEAGIDLKEAVNIAIETLQKSYKTIYDDAARPHNKSVSTVFRAFKNKYPHGVRGLGADGLHLAIFHKLTTLLDEMLKAGLDVNAMIPEISRTALGAAIHYPHNTRLLIVRKILEAGANVNCTVSIHGCWRKTALLEAIPTRDVALVQMLLDFGANIHEPAQHGRMQTPLQCACAVGGTELVDLLLNHGADPNEAPAYRHGATSLQLCAINGHVGTVLKLLGLGADVHSAPSVCGGRTPLQGAAENGRLDMISLLWKAAGNRKFSQQDCDDAMKLAKRNGHIACRDLIEELVGKSERV